MPVLTLNVGDVEWDRPGADISPDHFVRVVFAGGPAAAAGRRERPSRH